MNHSILQRIDPVDRYRRLCSALGTDHGWSYDRIWLRFAAQAAALRPARPEDTARAIHDTLERLRKQCSWSDSLQASIGQMVAATLVQIGDTADDFVADLSACRTAMHATGLPRSNWYELKAVLALRTLAEHPGPTPLGSIRRMHDIYEAMKSFHWWLTGRDHLPICALLSTCPGDANAIARNIEDIYQALGAGGLPPGHDQRLAASILPLAGLPTQAIVPRYLDVAQSFSETGLARDSASSVEAMLCLLDHEPAVIAARVKQLFHELNSGLPMETPVDVAIAADLCFIDLARKDRQMRLRDGEAELAEVRKSIARQRALAVMIAEVPHAPVTPEWPLMPWA